jgi:hypothetical protein
MTSRRPNPDTALALDDVGSRQVRSESDVDVRVLSPWPRLSGRPRRTTYRQVFTRSFVALVVAYVFLLLWSVFTPGRQMEPFEKGLIPVLLVGTPIVALLAAALTAVALTTAWRCCWASWNPHVSEVTEGLPPEALGSQS